MKRMSSSQLSKHAAPSARTQLAAATDLHPEESAYRPIDWSLIRRLMGLLAHRKKRYAFGIFLSLIMVALEMQSPLFVRWIIQVTTSPLPSSDAITRLVGIVAFWTVLWAAALLLQRATILIMTDAGERVQFDLRRAVFAHMQRLSMSFYDKTKLGRIISRCTSDISSLREINVWGVDTICKNVLMMIIAVAMLLATSPTLFLSVAWLGVPLYVTNRAYRRRASVAHQIAREAFTRVSANLAENITGARVVTAFHRQEKNLSVFNVLQEANTANNVAAARINGVYQPALQLIGLIGRVTLLVYGAYLFARGSISGGVGSVVAAFLYWDWFMNPIVNLGNFHNQLLTSLASAERVFDLLDTQPEITDAPNATPLPSIQGRVTFDHVTFGYDATRPVLHDIDFDIETGQVVALVGPTGGGKSSIISLLARFYEPQQGRVLIDRHDIRLATADSLHHQMGLVLQTNFLFSGTVMDNIRYARPDASDDVVIQAARNLGTHDTIMALADGFNTTVAERGSNMSIGQRQIICFTRAYLADPRIFMLDEATSSVDTATELVIQRSLERLLQNRTTFIVAHRLSTILRADLILVIDQGRILERGTHNQLRSSGGKYARLYEQFINPAKPENAGN
ncbi:MAG: ABC transporter ATP-binding protein [Planctomycetota bacterium]